MTFEEDALIDVLAHEEEGWWRGRLQSTGVEGLFPVNYVKPAPSNAAGDNPVLIKSSGNTSVGSCKPLGSCCLF